MSEDRTVDAIAQEIRARLDAVDQQVSDAKLNELIRSNLDDLVGDDEFVRKLRFDTDQKLVGSKYARLGMDATDIEMLHQILMSAKAVGKSSGPSEELSRARDAVSEGRYVRSVDLDTMPDRKARAMDTAESGFGQELVGAQYVADLWTGARAQSRVFSLIPSFNMTAPTSYLPVEADIPEPIFVSESTANNSSNYGTQKTGSNRVQVDAKKFVIHQMWSGEMEEDSIIPFIPFLRGQAQRSLAHYADALVLNGDTTNSATGNINLDDADPADTKYYLAFDGIRHAALVDNTNNGDDEAGAVAYASLTGLRAKCLDATYLHDWGHPVNPDDFVFVADPTTVDKISELSEVLTVEKIGDRATVLTGQQARIGQNPLISSIAVSRTEADGKVSTTGGNNTKGQVVAFNRNGFVTGIRRSLRVETERLPATDQTRIVYSFRWGFGRFTPTGAASGIEAAAVLYNIT